MSLVQMTGSDPVLMQDFLYIVDDQAGLIVSRWDASQNKFIPGNYPKPSALTPLVNDTFIAGIQSAFLNSGTFKPITQYLPWPDDVPMGIIFDLKGNIPAEQYASLKSNFISVPRANLRAWFESSVLPSISDQEGFVQDATWMAFVGLFNEANLAYCNTNAILPWDWEQQKTEMFYASQNQPGLSAVDAELATQVATSVDQTYDSLIARYNMLPVIGDPGLESRRKFAVKTLLDRKEYDTVDGIISAYEHLQYTVLANTLTAPIPFNIVTSDGQTITATKT